MTSDQSVRGLDARVFLLRHAGPGFSAGSYLCGVRAISASLLLSGL